MMLITLLSAALAYAIVCASGEHPRIVDLWTLLNSPNLIWQFLFFTVLFTALGIAAKEYRAKAAILRAAMSRRRHPKLRKLILAGVGEGSFAYLAKQVQYGTQGEANWLPAMSTVYVICLADEVKEDPTREPTAVCVPYFEGAKSYSPSMTVEVPLQDLYKHVPRHLIPELI
jgi:hypothetical protein